MKTQKKYLLSTLTTGFVFVIIWGASNTQTTSVSLENKPIQTILAKSSFPEMNFIYDDEQINVTFNIDCNVLLEDENIKKIGFWKRFGLPKKADIYSSNNIDIEEGETVFDLLVRICEENEIELDYSKSLFTRVAHVESIAEIDQSFAGKQSGWIYKVNGEYPNYSPSEYELKNGDVVEWVYTCDYGRDLNNGNRVYQ
ncbi:hypothetical protein AN643_04800 [Candidatus Epulonipiscioides saccharophilum]|nr:hypothetical protein AN643_04800 [Epulopiscium sp. SCG-B10WGA-EpuloB]